MLLVSALGIPVILQERKFSHLGICEGVARCLFQLGVSFSIGSAVSTTTLVETASDAFVLDGLDVGLGRGVIVGGGSLAPVPGLGVGDGPRVWVGVLVGSASAVASLKGVSVLDGERSIMIFLTGKGVLGGLLVVTFSTGVLDGANSFVAGVLVLC